jgi:hypothetical protein
METFLVESVPKKAENFIFKNLLSHILYRTVSLKTTKSRYTVLTCFSLLFRCHRAKAAEGVCADACPVRDERHSRLRVRHGGRRALLGQVVQERPRVLQICAQRVAEKTGLPY